MSQYKFLPEQNTSVSPVLLTSAYKDLIIFTRVSFGEMPVSVEKEGNPRKVKCLDQITFFTLCMYD